MPLGDGLAHPSDTPHDFRRCLTCSLQREPRAAHSACSGSLNLDVLQLSSAYHEHPRTSRNSALKHVITEEYQVCFCWKHLSCSHIAEKLWFKLQPRVQTMGQTEGNINAFFVFVIFWLTFLQAFTWALNRRTVMAHPSFKSVYGAWEGLSHNFSGNKPGHSFSPA